MPMCDWSSDVCSSDLTKRVKFTQTIWCSSEGMCVSPTLSPHPCLPPHLLSHSKQESLYSNVAWLLVSESARKLVKDADSWESVFWGHGLGSCISHFQVLRLLFSPGRGWDTVSDPGRQNSRQPRGGGCSEGKGRRLRGGQGGSQTGQQPPPSPRKETSPLLRSPRPAPHTLPKRQAGLGTSHPQASPQDNHAPHLRFTSSFPTHRVKD